MNVCLSKQKKRKKEAAAYNNILGAHTYIRLIYAYLYHGNTVFIKLLSLNVYIKIIVQHKQNFLPSEYTAYIKLVVGGSGTHQYHVCTMAWAKCASSCKWIINTCVCINMSCWRSGTWALNDRNNFFFAVLCLFVQFKPGLLKYTHTFILQRRQRRQRRQRQSSGDKWWQQRENFLLFFAACVFFSLLLVLLMLLFSCFFFCAFSTKKQLRFIRITFMWTI